MADISMTTHDLRLIATVVILICFFSVVAAVISYAIYRNTKR